MKAIHPIIKHSSDSYEAKLQWNNHITQFRIPYDALYMEKVSWKTVSENENNNFSR